VKLEQEYNMQLVNWDTLFEMPYKYIRDTYSQSLQYRILHRILPCNKWLSDIKIKDSPPCDYCNETDTIQHYILYCDKVNTFWKYILNWLRSGAIEYIEHFET
jgi:hypothetical protein